MVKHDIINRDAQKSSAERGTVGALRWKCNFFNVYFLQKVAIVLDDFKVMGSSFQIFSATTDKNRKEEDVLTHRARHHRHRWLSDKASEHFRKHLDFRQYTSKLSDCSETVERSQRCALHFSLLLNMLFDCNSCRQFFCQNYYATI